jgi:tetratricopeptide (TPR) repeat protein
MQESLAAAHPENIRFRVELAKSLYDISLLNYLLNHLDKALEAVKRGRDIALTAVPGKPKDPDARMILAICCGQLSYVLDASDRRPEAMTSYEESRATLESLVKDHPTSTEFRLRLVEGLEFGSSLFMRTGRIGEANSALLRAEEVMSGIEESNRSSYRYLYQAGSIALDLGDVLLQSGRQFDATAEYEKALALSRQAVRSTPDNPAIQQNLATSISRIAAMRQRAGRMEEAIPLLREAMAAFAKFPQDDPFGQYELTRTRSLLVGAGGKPGSGVSPEEARVEAEKAMSGLRPLVDSRFVTFDQLKTNHDLDSLRGRDDFRLLQLDRAFPIQPFAP